MNTTINTNTTAVLCYYNGDQRCDSRFKTWKQDRQTAFQTFIDSLARAQDRGEWIDWTVSHDRSIGFIARDTEGNFLFSLSME